MTGPNTFLLWFGLTFCWAGALWFFQGMEGDIPVFEFLVGTAAIVYLWRVLTEKKNN